MKLVVDANVVISALIADSKTRELIVTLEPELLTPEVVHDEIENYEDLIVERSGMDADRAQQFMNLLFQYIETVPASEFYPHIEEAEEAIGDTDPDDVLYVACAFARDAGVWSDDSDFDEQDLGPVFYLVRPDDYIGFRGAVSNDVPLGEYLREEIGLKAAR